MKFLLYLIREIMLNREKKRRLHKVVMTLAAVTVFVTTYALILPAITIDRNTASGEPGMVWENPDTAGGKKSGKKSETAESKSKKKSKKESKKTSGESKKAAEESKKAAKESKKAAKESRKAEEASIKAKEESKRAAEESQKAGKEAGKSAEEGGFKAASGKAVFEGSDYTVTVKFDKKAGLPGDVSLKVTEIRDAKKTRDAYSEYREKALKALKVSGDEEEIVEARFFRLAFIYDGEEIEPKAGVSVTFEWDKKQKLEENEHAEAVCYNAKQKAGSLKGSSKKIATGKKDVSALGLLILREIPETAEADEPETAEEEKTEEETETEGVTEGAFEEITSEADAAFEETAGDTGEDTEEDTTAEDIYGDISAEETSVTEGEAAAEAGETPEAETAETLGEEPADEESTVAEEETAAEEESEVTEEETSADEESAVIQEESSSEEESFATEEETAAEETSAAEEETVTEAESTVTEEDTETAEETSAAEEETVAEEESTVTEENTETAEETSAAEEETVAEEESTVAEEDTETAEETSAAEEETVAEEESTVAEEDTETAEETSAAEEETVAEEESIVTEEESSVIEESTTEAEEESSAAVEETTEEAAAEEGLLVFDGRDYSVTVKFDEDAGIPDDAELSVRELPKNSGEYRSYCQDAADAVEGEVTYARLFDIAVKSEDEVIEPAGEVNVTVALKNAVQEERDLHVLHFAEGAPQELDADVSEGGSKSGSAKDEIRFVTDGFAVEGIVGTETITREVLSSDGHNYRISVTYGPEAGIPADADLAVDEILSSSDKYSEYVEKTEEALGWDAGAVNYARFFDIRIVDANGGKVEIAAPVDVKIELADRESADSMQVVHFADGSETGDVVAGVDADGESVSFEAEGFSVYAVVDEGSEEDESRMKLEFYNGETLIATMYVKNSDDAEELKTILYDPGAGTMAEGETFCGWIIDKPDYTTADVADALDIDEIRVWAEAEEIAEGDEHRIDAVVCRYYKITYLDENGVSLGTDSIPVKAGEVTAESSPSVSYTVNQAYSPKDDTHNFEGWNVSSGGGHISGYTDGTVYTNGTEITLNGDVVFSVNAPEGHWLVFDQNGKGATYNAPQFVKSGEVTREPSLAMQRSGYSFGGWYRDAACTAGNEFSFGGTLSEKTTIYARWIPKARSKYTVIIWTQNIDGNGYDFKESIQLEGNTNTAVNTVVSQGTGDNAYARINGVNKQYEGFHLNNFDRNVTIVPEDNAVVNVYYDRTEYTLNFQVYDYAYTVSTNDNDNNPAKYGDVNGQKARVYWRNGAFRTTDRNNGPVYTGTVYTRSYSQSWQTIKTITALYKQNISGNFPITGTNGVTYDNGERWDPQSSTPYSEVLVFIDVMPAANVNFHLDTANRPLKTMNWYVEALPGTEGTVNAPNTLYEPSNNGVVSADGKKFILYKSISARYNGVTPDEDFIDLDGFTKIGADSAWVNRSGTKFYIYDTSRDGTVNFYYSRDSYKIAYEDGVYVNGYNNPVEGETSRGYLGESGYELYQGDLSSYNKGGDDYFEPEYDGYVFEGWYIDKDCTQPYNFTTMPKGGITVYAKWRQVQYRVFLHPNAGTDPSLDWGSENQEMTFRVSLGEKISTPMGRRTGYALVGWYLDEGLTQVFNADDFVLNETTVTTPYDKTVDMTDVMDKWGNGATTNSDITGYNGGDRFWITKKLDVYAKWRKIIDGADGINVIYDAGEGTNAPVDSMLYLDQAEAAAQAASTAPEGKTFKCWSVRRWDGTAYVDTGTEVFPGDPFTVNLDDARRTENADHSAEHPSYTYTVQLTAVYEEPEPETPTHIYWYANNGSSNTPEGVVKDEGLKINQKDPIKPADTFTYPHHRFLGWAKVPADNVDGEEHPELTASDLFLKWENGRYYARNAENAWAEVTDVAADEVMPFDDLYAVWEKVFAVTVRKTVEGFDTDRQTEFAFVSTGLTASQDAFTLRDGDSKEYSEVPAGTKFKFNETLKDTFTTKVEWRRTSDSDGNPLTGDAQEAFKTTENNAELTADADIEVVFTNTRKKADVEVKKVLVDPLAAGSGDFAFAAASSYTYNDGEKDVTETLALPEEDQSFTVTSGSAEGHVIEAYVGSTLTVTETEEGSYSVTADAAHGSFDAASGAYTLTVPEDGDTITFTNTRIARKIRIRKIGDDAGGGLAGGTFSLEAAQGAEIEGFEDRTGLVSMGSEQDAADLGFLPSDEEDNTVFTLPAGTYTLTETEAPEYYAGLTGSVTITVAESGITITPAEGDAGLVEPVDGDGIITLTVKNNRKKAKVTIIKNVVGTDADKDAEYSFTAAGLGDSSFVLHGRQKPETVAQGEVPEQANRKGYADIPYGTKFSVTEDGGYTDFTTGIDVSYLDDEGETKTVTLDPERPNPLSTGDITVMGDTTVIYTNTRKQQEVVIYKTDDAEPAANQVPLGGAEFTLNDGAETRSLTSASDAADRGYTESVILPVNGGPDDRPYDLTETNPPAGYNALSGPVRITVRPDGVSYIQSDYNGGSPQTAAQETVNGRQVYVIHVVDHAGVVLPSTGGPGTRIFRIFGGLLIAGAGALLLMRRRRTM